MSNHLVIIERSNDDSIIKVMTRNQIVKRGRKGLTIIEGNLLKGFGEIMNLKPLIKMNDARSHYERNLGKSNSSE